MKESSNNNSDMLIFPKPSNDWGTITIAGMSVWVKCRLNGRVRYKKRVIWIIKNGKQIN